METNHDEGDSGECSLGPKEQSPTDAVDDIPAVEEEPLPHLDTGLDVSDDKSHQPQTRVIRGSSVPESEDPGSFRASSVPESEDPGSFRGSSVPESEDPGSFRASSVAESKDLSSDQKLTESTSSAHACKQVFLPLPCLPYEDNPVYCFILSAWDNIIGPQTIQVWQRTLNPNESFSKNTHFTTTASTTPTAGVGGIRAAALGTVTDDTQRSPGSSNIENTRPTVMGASQSGLRDNDDKTTPASKSSCAPPSEGGDKRPTDERKK